MLGRFNLWPRFRKAFLSNRSAKLTVWLTVFQGEFVEVFATCWLIPWKGVVLSFYARKETFRISQHSNVHYCFFILHIFRATMLYSQRNKPNLLHNTSFCLQIDIQRFSVKCIGHLQRDICNDVPIQNCLMWLQLLLSLQILKLLKLICS